MSRLARCSPFFSYMVILPAPWIDTASAALNRKSSAWVASSKATTFAKHAYQVLTIARELRRATKSQVALGALSLRRLVLFEKGAEAPPPEGNAKFGGLAQFGEGGREQRTYLRLLSHQIDARRNDVRRTNGGTKIQARRAPPQVSLHTAQSDRRDISALALAVSPGVTAALLSASHDDPRSASLTSREFGLGSRPSRKPCWPSRCKTANAPCPVTA
jgi:hypothetical protein